MANESVMWLGAESALERDLTCFRFDARECTPKSVEMIELI